jgi:hypothetical protein
VTGTEESDWTISYQPSQERYEAGLATYKAGDRMGFVQALYARECESVSAWPPCD